MKVLTILTYYHPHWTGLTMIAQRIAEGLARQGHEVTVLTTQHQQDLARNEVVDGVRVIRLRQIGRLSRGVVAPSFPVAAHRLIGETDVVQIHTPLMEGAMVGALCRVQRRPLLMTHQGDLVMPEGLVNQAIQRVGTTMLSLTARSATRITTHNADYLENSSFLQPFRAKSTAIYPPIDIPAPQPEGVAALRSELGLQGKRLVGFAGRFVEEKGFDSLLRAIPALLAAVPDAQLVYAGEHNIVYERFFERCQPLIEQNRSHLTFVGLVNDRQRLANFYGMCDVFVLPSRTDCFASVQVEAMLAGTPVVATNIPGGREAVRRTGMGLLVSPHDPAALADGLATVLSDPGSYERSRSEIRAVFDPEQSIDQYEEVLGELVG